MLVSGDCDGWRLILIGGSSVAPNSLMRSSACLPTCGGAPSCCTTTSGTPIAASVAKRRRGAETRHVQFDLNQLSEDVSAAYEAYTTDTLDGIWAYKSEIMQKIIEADGGNWYNKRRGLDAHGRKRARSGE